MTKTVEKTAAASDSKANLLGLLAKSSTGSARDSVFGLVDFVKFEQAVKMGTVTVRPNSVKQQILAQIIEKFEDGESFGVKAAEIRGFCFTESKMTVAANLRWYKDWLKETILS